MFLSLKLMETGMFCLFNPVSTWQQRTLGVAEKSSENVTVALDLVCI
jgi:hypothetical protein